MKPLLQIVQFSVVVLLSSSLVACGPAVRTADGDCYYRGKGVLALGATLLDSASAWADAELEVAYQKDQITLQQLENKLDAIDPDALQSDEEILAYNTDVDRYNLLLDRVNDYQERKQQALQDGPKTSYSKQVDESGDCG